jgi:hypothetical protein
MYGTFYFLIPPTNKNKFFAFLAIVVISIRETGEVNGDSKITNEIGPS